MRKANDFCELSYNCANISIKVNTAVDAILWDLILFWKRKQLTRALIVDQRRNANLFSINRAFF